MHGVGRATAAVSIVNALPTGIGCALGIGLEAEVTIDLEPRPNGSETELTADPTHASPVVTTAFRLAVAKFLGGRPVLGRLVVRSAVPVARGLKSSSAVASATARAVAAAAGARDSPEEIARLSAVAARTAGVSATGAFDDALAGVQPGFVVTDNGADQLLRSGPAEPGWEAALLVPETRHRPSPEWAPAFAREGARGREAAELARAGKWWAAMECNTKLVESVIGYAYEPLRTELRAAGALAAGVSGLGPALAAIQPAARTEEVVRVLRRHEGEVLKAPVSGSPIAARGLGP